MAYSGFVHRDIAARNCLVKILHGELVVKVSDFGLARELYQGEYYTEDGSVLPIPWMAPEAVVFRR